MNVVRSNEPVAYYLEAFRTATRFKDCSNAAVSFPKIHQPVTRVKPLGPSIPA